MLNDTGGLGGELVRGSSHVKCSCDERGDGRAGFLLPDLPFPSWGDAHAPGRYLATVYPISSSTSSNFASVTISGL